MAATAPAPAPEAAIHELPRTMGLRDLVLFNIVAVLSLRWFATAAAAGPSSISFWVLAALLFFVPQGLAVSHLSSRYPNEGGIYYWAKRQFGEGHGFLCGWCYWVNNILYYPNLLMSTAVVGTYAFGRGGTGLESNWSY
ncbi:MAG TPA: amino acid permease, partial [Methylomirabilota bacterium]